MTLNGVPMEYVTYVKYFGFMFTSDSKDGVDMQRQLRTFYARSNTILRQFAKGDESVKFELFYLLLLPIFMVGYYETLYYETESRI